MEYYSALKRWEILPHAATWMNHRNITLTDIGESHKDTQCVISLIGATQSHLNSSEKRQKGGCQGLGREEKEGGIIVE
jgi:hypothetical protein